MSEEKVEIDALILLQNNRLSSLKKILKNFNKDTSTRKTKPYFTHRFNSIKELNQAFHETHDRVICSLIDEEDDYVKNDVASQFEEQYLEVFCVFSERQDELHPPPTADTTDPQAQPQQHSAVQRGPPSIQFPQLPVPSFSGKFTEWPSFYDAFKTLIHLNNDLSGIQKFNYLKRALPDDRDVDIQQMLLTETNYTTAWDLLINRYDNPRILFAHHMNSLYSLPVLYKEKSNDIKSMLNAANVCINEFKRLHLPISGCDHWIAHYLVTKLPNDTHQAWEHHLGNKTEIPTFSELEDFLTNRLFTIDAIENRTIAHNAVPGQRSAKDNKTIQHFNSPKTFSRPSSNAKSFHITSKPNNNFRDSCNLCGEAHLLRRCHTFLSKDCFERKSIVDKAKLCLNCLSKSHALSQCTSSKNCLQCGQRHHTLLHFPTVPKTTHSSIAHCSTQNTTTNSNALATNHPYSSSPLVDQASTSAAARRFTNAHATMASYTTQFHSDIVAERFSPCILLATALVNLFNEDNEKSAWVYALIDQGSEAHIISEHAAQCLGLKHRPTAAEICGVNPNSFTESKSVVSLSLRSSTDSTFTARMENAFVVKNLSITLPSHRVEQQNWLHLQGLTLADPFYYKSKKIDLIIGAGMLAEILLPDIRIGLRNQPIAQKTHLGWILSGHASSTQTRSVRVNCNYSTIELEALVQRFYESEQVPTENPLSEQDRWCEEFFRTTHVRQDSGKYLVRLPLKCLYDPNQTLGKSKQIALNRFYQLERRLQQDTNLRDRYVDGIKDYFHLKQIVPATTSESQHCILSSSDKPTITSCVLPHHAVIKEDSQTTKIRIVYDASSKTSNGRSLNDMLCTGPPLQNDLPGVILNWRMHQYVFLADIQKMYRCINMHPDDAQYQRILWRNNDGQIQEYCLTTVTFGTASAPYTAIRVLHQIAEDEKTRFPLAEKILKYDIYVDDVQSGSYSIEDALQMRDQLIAALKSAGMELRKWSSNTPELLQSIPADHRSDSICLQLNGYETVKTLGLYWQPSIDSFTFQINFTLNSTATKRSVLSTIARLFDPLGLIAPVTIAAKIILKEIWSIKVVGENEQFTNIGWDEELPESVNTTWQHFLTQLPHINKITIPRWFQYTPQNIKSFEIHAFCDGSSSAYAAAVYFRIQFNDDQVYTHLVAAKSKVTPTKPETIPRVELCGAVLATTLSAWVRQTVRGIDEEVKTYYWTDATIVLFWINGDINRWKLYVANRISKILSLTDASQWGHVRSAENPADCATRGLVPDQLVNFQLWWTGPLWLSQPKSMWPRFHIDTLELGNFPMEEKPKRLLVHVTLPADSIIQKYSSLNTLVRVYSFILRFIHNSRVKDQNSHKMGPISASELQHSLLQIVKQVQQEVFKKEIRLLQTKESLPNNSKLISLTPFLDSENLLRVRGRLQRSLLSYRRKHPLILPRHHHFTKLIIDNAHQNTLHGGAQLTLALIRQTFWIIDSRKTVRDQLRHCVTCFRNKPQVSSQLMGELPAHRITPPSRAFLATGVDFTGAIELKSSKYRGNTVYKGYIAIFICLATKAVHLEAVTSLATEQFLWALQRFIGRRGICHDIYSDCGTNFIGAEAVLQINQKKFIEDVKREIIPKLAEQNTQWHFNPPYSPNFGGLWEANVKSIKYHLKRTVGGNRLTYEELATVLVRIEACLNSRPLCPLTSDTDDLFVLTPGHFLIGDALLSPPEMAPENKCISKQFLEMQQMVQRFWTKWSSDWLSHLQARPKWRRLEPNLQVNELVLIKDDRLPPNQWLLGRVMEVHPGPDQLVRVVTVRTKSGTYKRSVSKICRLPIPIYTDDDTPSHTT